MRLRLHLICAALVFSFNCLYPQDHLPGRIINMIEDITEMSGEDMAVDEFMEEITKLAEDPVKINSGDENEIKRIFFLTPFQVRSIIEYTGKYGSLISVNELMYIPGFDSELAKLVSPFIILEQKEQIRTGKKGHISSITNFISDSQRDETNYIGKDHKLLTRTRYTGGSVEANLILEKDRGEKFLLPGCQPEFLSANITCRSNGILNRIIIGDYKVRFGQGLTAWNGFSRSPSLAEPRLMKGSSMILPYTSSGENDFFRGLALSFNAGKTNIMAFVSTNMIDATTEIDQDTGKPYIKSFYTTGLHNTLTTLQKRNTIKETALGIHANRMVNNLYLGLSGIYSKFSLPVKPDRDIRNIYDFSGNNNACAAFEYAYLFRDSYLFGEIAMNESGKTAFLQGLSLNPDGKVRMNIIYTRINRGYNSYHGNPTISEVFNSPSENLLANISVQPASFISFQGGILHKKQLWYNNISAGFPFSLKYLLGLKIDPCDFLSVSSDIKHVINDSYIVTDRGMKTGVTGQKTNFRLSFETVISEQVSLRTRIEKVMITGASEHGILCYQSFNYDFRRIALGIRCRLCVFRTGSYDSRIYTWEDDLLYSPTVKALYDNGKRGYIMLVYSPVTALTIRAKYAASNIPHPEEKSGIIREYKLQAVIKF